MATKSYSNLKNSKAAWNPAVRDFGIVTVMNAKVYNRIEGTKMSEYAKDFTNTQLEALYKINPKELEKYITKNGDAYTPTEEKIDFRDLKVNEIIALYLQKDPLAELKYLKTANATQEGPTKTVTGGQNVSPLIKYGKTARLEMQDALGNAEALEALAGLTVEYFRTVKSTDYSKGATDVLHATTTFAGHKAIIGDTFIIDAETGSQVPAYIIFYDFLSDSILSLTQDAEGDATVFDMNGDLGETKILIGDNEEVGNENGIITGVFYSIIPQLEYATNPTVIEDNGLDSGTNSDASAEPVGD